MVFSQLDPQTRQPFYSPTILPTLVISVYSLSGSILTGRDAESLKEYALALKELAQEHQIYVVVGGGRIAR